MTRSMARMSPRRLMALAALAATVVLTPIAVYAHCQIPCGIYGDQTRFDLLNEHITTLEKSINQINELSESPGENANQLIRWVNNKEEHADKFAEIMTQYFLQQRIKPVEGEDAEGYEDYVEQVTLAHKLLVAVMKTKQSADTDTTAELKKLLDRFEAAYMDEEMTAHLTSHHNEGGEEKPAVRVELN